MGKHSRLINKLWEDPGDRKLAESFAKHFDGMPGMEDRIPALLQEASKPTEMSPQESWDYLRSFAASIGTPPTAMAAFGGWFDTTAAEVAAETPPEPEEADPEDPDIDNPPLVRMSEITARQPAAAPAPPARPALDREAARDRVYQMEQAMRAEVGSPEWSSYWRNPQAQEQYRAALEVTHGIVAEPAGESGEA